VNGTTVSQNSNRLFAHSSFQSECVTRLKKWWWFTQ
jgi:hypothetical protein